MSHPSDYDVIIAGGGPAGSSAAIHLASSARVLLVEQKRFPRPKLCGEFISPECAAHFERLGVAEQMLATGPSNLIETVFYSQTGARVSVPSDWFASGGAALGLSRAEMDERLLRRAARVGVEVVEDASVVNVAATEARDVSGVIIRRNGKEESVRAPLTIDATGRARALARFVERDKGTRRASQRRPMVAFKAHFTNTRVAPGACEIYFYRGGDGGATRDAGWCGQTSFLPNPAAGRTPSLDSHPP